MNLSIDVIRTDGGTQPRAQIDWVVVDEYVEAMKSGAQFPPVVVFHDGAKYWLADGFHRLDAARRAEVQEVAADVRQGTQRDAILYSVGANASHGLRRTNEDKRRAVKRLLEDGEWGRKSNVWVAEQAKVTEFLVRKLKIENPHFDLIEVREVRTKHGTVATMNTANIGKQATVEEAPGLWDGEEDEEDDDLRYMSGLSAYCKYCYTYQTEWDFGDEYGVWACPNCEHSTADANMQIGGPMVDEVEWDEERGEDEEGKSADAIRDAFPRSITIHNINSQYLAAHITEPVHMVVTSPPYNVDTDYSSHKDSLSTYIELLTAVWRQCHSVMVEGARIAVVVPFGVGRNPWVPLAARVAETLQDAGFTLRGQIIWDKGTSGGRTSWGSFRLPSDPSLRDTCEAIVIAHKGLSKLQLPPGTTRTDEKGSFSPWLAESERFMELAQDHWSIAPESATRVKHPAPFPTELVERLLRFYAFPAAHVIDPFSGSGTVGIVAHSLGCSATLFDIDAAYCELAKRRINDFVSANVK